MEWFIEHLSQLTPLGAYGWLAGILLLCGLGMPIPEDLSLIEGDESPQPTLPVLQREIFAVPFRHPTIARVRLQSGLEQPMFADSTIVIEGRQLRGEITQLRIGGSDLMTLQDVEDTKIVFPLASLTPAGALRAGMQALQIVQPLMMGQPRVPHTGIESNVAALIIRPTITIPNPPSATQIDLSVDPVIGAAQRVVLQLYEISNSAPETYTFRAPARTADTNSISIPISGVKPADYVVRLQVDGAESILDLDPVSPNFGPKVTIP